jgi:hypothetical protein
MSDQAKILAFTNPSLSDYSSLLASSTPEFKAAVEAQMKALGEGSEVGQQFKLELEEAIINGKIERAEKERLLAIYRTEQAVIAEKIKKEYELNKVLNSVIQSANRLDSSFSLLEKKSNLTGVTSFSDSAGSQLGDLSNISDPSQLNKALASVGRLPGFSSAIADTRKAISIQGSIKAPGGITSKALAGISPINLQSQLSQAGGDSEKVKEILSGASSGLEQALSNMNVDKVLKKNLVDDFEKMLRDTGGSIDTNQLQEMLGNKIQDFYGAGAEKVQQAYTKQVEALNKFAQGLRIVSDLENKIASQRVAGFNSQAEFFNQLTEMRSERPTTAARLGLQSVARQRQMLSPQDAGLAGNARGMSEEIRNLQAQISMTEEKFENLGNATNANTTAEIAAQEDRKQRVDKKV